VIRHSCTTVVTAQDTRWQGRYCRNRRKIQLALVRNGLVKFKTRQNVSLAATCTARFGWRRQNYSRSWYKINDGNIRGRALSYKILEKSASVKHWPQYKKRIKIRTHEKNLFTSRAQTKHCAANRKEWGV